MGKTYGNKREEIFQIGKLGGSKGVEHEVFFGFLLIMCFLRILANRLQTFNFTYVECYAKTNNKGRDGSPKKNKKMKDVNDDEFGVVLEVTGKGNFFYNSMRDIVERMLLDVLFTYNTKINNEYKNQEPIQHSLLWYVFLFIQSCILYYKYIHTHYTLFPCL
jgi:hypothetical protein